MLIIAVEWNHPLIYERLRNKNKYSRPKAKQMMISPSTPSMTYPLFFQGILMTAYVTISFTVEKSTAYHKQ